MNSSRPMHGGRFSNWIHRFRLVAIILSLAGAVHADGPSLPTIRQDRPRVLFDSADLERIRKTIALSPAGDFKALKMYVEQRMVETPPKKLSQSAFDSKLVASVAFVARFTGEGRLLDLARGYGIEMASTEPSFGDDMVQRQRLLSMAYVYDWLYDSLPPAERTLIRNAIIGHIKHLKYFLNAPLYSGGHSRYGAAVILAALIALDDSDWTERRSHLDVVRREWEEGYNPFQAFAGKGGGYHMGWRYGLGYTDPLSYLVWEKATGVRWSEEWRREQIYWLIYGTRGDGSLPRSGDCWNTEVRDDNIALVTSVSAGLFKNPHAEWFYRRHIAPDWEPRRLYRILFFDPSVPPRAPDDPTRPLPPARLFPGAGFVVARDGWGPDTTQLVFKSTPFYSRNHHHKDQNHFELSYKGSLLIDSGVYDAFSSIHWKNYYSRTIAHNSLVVHDPTEQFYDGAVLSNDGGQRYPDSYQVPVGMDPLDLAEALNDKYRLDGVTGFLQNSSVVWMRGEATRAYGPKVKRYLRDIAMIDRPAGREHPCLLVLDRVELSRPLVPQILFHSNPEPALAGDSFTISNAGGGMVRGKVLLPVSARMDAIGGPGREWYVDGKNYPPSKIPADCSVDPGAWRVEAGTADPVREATFLTLLAVDDRSRPRGMPGAVSFTGKNHVGVILGKELILFYTDDSPPPSEWSFQGPEFDPVRSVRLVGTTQADSYTFTLNGRKGTYDAKTGKWKSAK